MYPELSKAIKARCGSEAELARKINWTRQKVHYLTNGRKQPDVNDLNALAKGLDLSIHEILNFFI